MIEVELNNIWVYLHSSPLTGLTLTLLTYTLSYQLYRYYNHHPLLNPVVLAVLVLIGFLWFTDTSYQEYFAGGQYIHFLLGPATVALAVPLYQHWHSLKKIWPLIMLTVLTGGLVSALSSLYIAQLLGTDSLTQLSLVPKSVTAPVAMSIAEKIGGLPSLTAGLVVFTGIFGAVIASSFFRLLRVKDDRARGIAIGIAAHGIGTSRAFHLSQQMGSYAGLAMALSALLSALLLPQIIPRLHL